MKKNLLAIIVALLYSTAAFSQFIQSKTQHVGFTSPIKKTSTIIEARQFPDHSKITIEGRIILHLGGDNYLFSDDHDTITIEIGNEVWHSVQVRPEDTVKLYGVVNKESNYTNTEIKIDVHRIMKK